MTQALVMYGVPLFVYSLQILTLLSLGYRVISVSFIIKINQSINTSPQMSTALE